MKTALSFNGWQCDCAGSAQEAYALICRQAYDVIVSDISMPDMTGFELLDKVVAIRPESRMILMTGMGSVDWAKQAIRRGAFDYIEKPFDVQELRRVVTEAVLDRRQDTPSEDLRAHVSSSQSSHPVLIHRDPLTGLINHRRFHEELAYMRAQCRRHSFPLSVLLLDLDDFTEINVKYGHAFGDVVLRELADRLRSCCRQSDLLARYSGQQFAMGLLETTAPQAVQFARRVRTLVSNHPFKYADADVYLGVCIGIAECDPGFIESEGSLLQRAQQAVSQAKARGASSIANWDDLVGTDAAGQQLDTQKLSQLGEQFEQLHQRLRKSYIESTEALIAAVEAKDPYTKRHSLHVANYAAAIAEQLDLEGDLIQVIETAAILHDIGKIGIPDHILTKTDALTDDEFSLIRLHPAMAVQILQRVSFLRAELPMILHHHERWDGQGYPEGLSGEAIPLGARILHVADSIEAMLARRSYKDSYSVARVIDELERGRETQFDPRVVDAALKWLDAKPEALVLSSDDQDHP